MDLLVAGEHIRMIGDRHALIESKSVPGEWHAVEWDGRWFCTCMGYQCKKRCRHITTLEGLFTVLLTNHFA